MGEIPIKFLNGDFLLLGQEKLKKEDILFLFKHKKKKSLSPEDFAKSFVNCPKEKLTSFIQELAEESLVVISEDNTKITLK